MRYTVTVRREGSSWLAEVEGLEGAHTFAPTLVQLDAYVREVIALIEDFPEGSESDLNLDWIPTKELRRNDSEGYANTNFRKCSVRIQSDGNTGSSIF